MKGKSLIRHLDEGLKIETGRKIYEARAAGMVWADAARLFFDNEHGLGYEESARATYLARLYAMRERMAWPPPAPPRSSMPGYKERRAAISARRAERSRVERLCWGADIKELRQSLCIDDDLFQRSFHLSAKRAADIERFGPINSTDYDTVMNGLNDIARRRAASRDWLILTDGPARFTNDLTATA